MTRICRTRCDRSSWATIATQPFGWAGAVCKRDELLQRAAADEFDALITNDRGLEYEQNPATLPLAIVVLLADDNKSATIERAVPMILDISKRLQPKTITRIVVT